MPNFTGTLRKNDVLGLIYNMIINQRVFSRNITLKNRLVDKAKRNVGLYGDTELFYATDVLKSVEWGKDGATNVLELHRPESPECQSISIDKYRQIALTLDNYLTKQAWGTEGAFNEFQTIMQGWMSDTKDLYDVTTYNAFFGTCESADETVVDAGSQNISFTISDKVGNAEGIEKEKLEGMYIAQKLADLIDDLAEPSRVYNDYGNLRSYDPAQLKIVFNNKWVNKIKKVDLPALYHNDIIKMGESLNHRYFGHVKTTSGTTEAENVKIRSLIEKDYGDVHVFPGDLLPNATAYEANEVYEEDEKIICKIVVEYPPYLSAFSVGTSFFNPRSLTENFYTTWGHNTLEHLYNFPMITVHAD